MANQYRELIAKFLDRVAADPAFREQLRVDTYAALEASGFAQEARALHPDWETPEVTGFSACTDTCFNQWTCLSDSCYVTI